MENIHFEGVHIDLERMEHTLRNKLIELQIKTNSLEETQQELAQARQSLYETERAREVEKRDAALLRVQLDVASTAVRRWEEEKTVNRCQRVQATMHSETIIRERDSLLHQTKNLQLENMMLKQKIHEFQTIGASRETFKETLIKLENEVTLCIKTANSEIPRLHQDLSDLEKSIEATNKLNGRLQAAGMCAYGIQQKYKMRIAELESKLSSINLFKH